MRVVVLICCAAALLAAGGSLVLPGRFETVLIAAVAMLVCAQVVALLAAAKPNEIEDAKLAALSERINRNAASIDSLTTRSKDHAQALAELQKGMKQAVAKSKPVNGGPATPARLTATAPRVLQQSQHLQQPLLPQAAEAALYLEPVVRLGEGRTAYYKASLQRPAQIAGGIPQPAISADLPLRPGMQTQWASHHDLTLLDQVMPVMGKLRARRGATGIFVPVSVATLEGGDSLEALVEVLRSDPDAAAGIVLDINMTALASLPESAMRGLAWLASLGATFCLTGPGAANSDLSALAELGFAFFDVPAPELVGQAGQPNVDALRFAQAAAAHSFTIIASGIGNNAQAAAVAQAASLARGPGFALPRAVRPHGAGVSADRQVA